MFWKDFVKDYLIFTRKERIGILGILAFIVGIYFLPKAFKKQYSSFVVKTDSAVQLAVDSLQKSTLFEEPFTENRNYTSELEPSRGKGFSEKEIFAFDPNTLSTGGWQRLGLNDRTIKTINNYRSKGGKFYKAEDLMRIWGVPGGFYERVKDHITIAFTERKYPQQKFDKPVYENKRPLVVDINSADTSAFIALPGIGSKLAGRIVAFREKSGGFYSVEQVRETYGLPDSSFQKIKPLLQVNGSVKKPNVNTATKDELKLHPYIKWNIANVIVEYRNQHGAFKSLEDLKSIAVIDEVAFNKIRHYLVL